jgi:hypothetical protein
MQKLCSAISSPIAGSPAVARRQPARHPAQQHQRTDDDGRDAAAQGHRGEHVHAMVEGQAGGDVVRAHHQRDQQQRCKRRRRQACGQRVSISSVIPARRTAAPKTLG